MPDLDLVMDKGGELLDGSIAVVDRRRLWRE
jgi:hypothetical protein